MAQDTSWLRPDALPLRMPWLTSENAAGLTVLPADLRISETGCYGEVFSGDLHNYHEAHDGYRWGLKGMSYHPVAERVAVWGEVDYSNFLGRDMTGSYFIDPSQAPFNLVEFTPGNAGNKQLETYHLAGAVGADLTRRMSGGLKMDYTAANYAKRKDLRHTNSLMDMTLTAGLNFRLGKRFTFGANYAYRRRNESLLLSMYGTTDKRYYTLVDYGAFFGKREQFSDTGYTKEDEAKPLFDHYHGGAVQLSWRPGTRWEWFNELGVRIRNGHYGDDSPSTVVYSTHTGQSLAYKGQLVYAGARNIHTLRLEAEQRRCDNRENMYDFRNDAVGINYYVYLGEAEVGRRTEQTASLRYTGQWDIREGLPRWQTALLWEYDHRTQQAVNYPDYRRQDIAWWRLSFSLQRNFRSGRNLYTACVDAGYGSGNGTPFEEGRYHTSNEVVTLTRTLNALLMHDYEYLTAARIQSGATIRYTRLIGGKGLRGFVGLDYDFLHAFDTSCLGNGTRQTVSLQIGCNF